MSNNMPFSNYAFINLKEIVSKCHTEGLWACRRKHVDMLQSCRVHRLHPHRNKVSAADHDNCSVDCRFPTGWLTSRQETPLETSSQLGWREPSHQGHSLFPPSPQANYGLSERSQTVWRTASYRRQWVHEFKKKKKTLRIRSWICARLWNWSE